MNYAMNGGLVWVLAGLALLGAEVAALGVFLMWLGIAAVGAGVVDFAAGGISLKLQVIIFAVLAAASIGAGIRLRHRAHPAKTLNTAASGLVGRTATVLSFAGREGRVRVGDSDWAAEVGAGAATPALGATLRVEAVRGIVLLVRPAD
jgi:membrane protein implicated in regulation of membrane protease activity